MKFSPIQIIKYQLYLLQLENYSLQRFQTLFWRRLILPAAPMRQNLAWTAKLKIIAVLATIIQLIIFLFIVALMFAHFSTPVVVVVSAVLFYITSALFGLWAMAAVLIVLPADYLLKQYIISQAKKKLKQHKKLIIVGITGSYGKTTLKEFISEVLSTQYKVLKTEGNKNTPLGIANVILDQLSFDTEVFIIEMGAYQKGDIKQICEIASPDISILTGINESHLERFGTIQNTIATKFEIVQCARPQARVILNSDNDLVLKYYQDYIKSDQKVAFYSAYNNKLCDYRVIDKQFLSDSICQTADIMHKSNSVGTIKTMFLGEYVFGDIIAAIMVARILGVSLENIRHGITNLKPINHRLQPIRGQNDILVIDDSYNGSFNGVEEAIFTLSHFKNRRKIYVTPGLVEAAHEARQLHYHIGKILAKTADLVVLIKNSVTIYIEQGLLEAGFAKDNIIFFKNATEAHKKIQELTKPGDIVLFQNDWPDNYM